MGIPRRHNRSGARLVRCQIIALALIASLAAGLLASGCTPDKPKGPLASDDYVPVGTTVVPEKQVPMAGVVKPPESGAFVGVFRPPAPFAIDSLDSYAEVSEKPPAILMWFQPWAPGGSNLFDAAAVVSTLRRGAVPMITWEPWDPGEDPNLSYNPVDQPEYRLQRVVDGEFDRYIRTWARNCAAVGGPVMLRPMHEMNGVWYPWGGTVNGNTPEIFRKAWIHVHDIFEEEGATNVTWVWSINASTHPNTPENQPSAYYPGDDYVDWTAISGFNWGTSRPNMNWETFNSIYRDVIPYLETLGKPIVISEFASVEAPGDKAGWITDAYRRIRTQHPSVKAVVYYDKPETGLKGEQDWAITSSTESAKAYRAAVGDSYFIGGPIPTLEQWATGLTGDDWVHLNSYRRLY